MDDQDITLSLAADLRALLPVVRHHLTMLSTPATARQDPAAGPELAHLTRTMADDCAQAAAEDCALLFYALHDHFSTSSGPLHPRFAALAWDALTFVQERVDAMGAAVTPRIPTMVQRAQAERLVRALAETPDTSYSGLAAPAAVSGSFPLPDVSRDDSGGELTDREREMVQEFHAATLRRSERDQFTASPVDADQVDTTPLPEHVSTATPSASSAAPPSPVGATTGADRWHGPTAEELDYIPPEMKQLFLVETTDDAQDLRLALLRFEQSPDDTSSLAAMGRITHKIKGAAATLGFETLAQVLLSFEDVIKAVQSRRIAADARAGDALVREMALVQEALDTAESETTLNTAVVEQARLLYESLLADDVLAAASASSNPDVPPVVPNTPGSGDISELPTTSSGESESYLRVDVRRLDELMRHISALAVNRAAVTQTREEAIRLQAEMDQALVQVNGLSGQITDHQPILRASGTGERTFDGGRGRGEDGDNRFRMLSGDHARSDRDRSSGDSASSSETRRLDWDALEMEQFTEFDHALRKLNEVVADIDTTSRQLRTLLVRLSQLSDEQSALASRMQRDVMHVRLVPLKNIVPRLELEALRLGPLTGKAVAFSVRGEMTEIDRNISESLAGPLLQLVRNAIVHGIEPPEERRELGKPEAGQIWMHAYYVGSEVIIEVGDDGRGINTRRLAASAMLHGELDAEAARNLGTTEALELMFHPGITSFEAAQIVGGRGIGLDDVRTTISALKGSITVRSEPGQGTVFRMRVPISLSIVHVLRVGAADQQYAVPFSSVQRTLSLSASELLVSAPSRPDERTVPDTSSQRRIRIERVDSALAVGELPESERYEEIPVFALAELLGVEHAMHDPQMALLVEVGRRRVALLVDGIHEDQEVVVQALPPHLRRRALRGASVTPNGQLLLLLDVPELIAGMLDGKQAPPEPRPRPVHPVVLAPRVLIVDDSVSIRRTLEHTLQRSGFEVQVAKDGIEALEVMMASAPRVLVLDIEMPRLDGFELLSIVRESPQFAGVRVAMLTSRAANKHKEHARSLGAEAYLVKPCPQETLIETVRALLAEPAAVS